MSLVAIGALLVAALAVVSHARDRSTDPGVTTELALLCDYLIGVLSVSSLPLAAGAAVGLTALLASRSWLHRFARQWLQPFEVRDGLILAAIVLIALPLLPDRALLGVGFNPYQLMRLLALLLAIQALAHVCQRLLAARSAVLLSALAAGFISSTATIASAGMAVREGRAPARLQAGRGLLSCVSTVLQIGVVAAALQPLWLRWLAPALLVGVVVTLGLGWWLVHGAVAPDGELPRDPAQAAAEPRMFSLRDAALVALGLTVVQMAVHGLGRWLGPVAGSAGVLLAALFDVHAALAAVFAQGAPPTGGPNHWVWAAAGVMVVHSLNKSAVVWLSGGRAYARWLVPMLWLHTLPLVLLTLWSPLPAG
jgi:uncharacterized membrane protein (DUF4010 family)